VYAWPANALVYLAATRTRCLQVGAAQQMGAELARQKATNQQKDSFPRSAPRGGGGSAWAPPPPALGMHAFDFDYDRAWGSGRKGKSGGGKGGAGGGGGGDGGGEAEEDEGEGGGAFMAGAAWFGRSSVFLMGLLCGDAEAMRDEALQRIQVCVYVAAEPIIHLLNANTEAVIAETTQWTTGLYLGFIWESLWGNTIYIPAITET